MNNILIYGMSSKFGGVEEYLMNVYRNIDRTKFKFGFIITDGKKVYCEDEIKMLGGEVYYPDFKSNFEKNKSLKQLFKELRKKYDVVYFNTSSIYNIFPYIYAKKMKFKKYIVHAHNTKDTSKSEYIHIFHYVNRFFVSRFSDELLACSKIAGEWVFGKYFIKSKKSKIIYNAINIDKFRFDSNLRNKIREELNIGNKFVIGHIGRFIYQKNHIFLINIFRELLKENRDIMLLLIGEGELEKNIKEKVKEYGIEKNVIFYGTTNKANEIYSAMDLFVLPSHYEGLPVVGIEAQVNGLNCVFSNNITDELKLNKNVEFIGINNSEQWIETINKLRDGKNRIVPSKELIEKYSINHQISTIAKVLNIEE